MAGRLMMAWLRLTGAMLNAAAMLVLLGIVFALFAQGGEARSPLRLAPGAEHVGSVR